MNLEQAEQKPVAWVEVERGIPMFMNFTDDYKPNIGNGIAPLYAAPQPVQQAEQEPVAWNNTVDEVRFKEPVIQEPVAWMDAAGAIHKHKLQRDWQPLYAAPVRTKDLTDDEIYEFVCTTDSYKGFARAVIAADREKNRGTA